MARRAFLVAGLLSLALLTGFMLLNELPRFAAAFLANRLRAEGVTVEQFGVSGIGLSESAVGQGRLVVREAEVDWEQIHVSYGLGDLLRRRVDTVTFSGLSIGLNPSVFRLRPKAGPDEAQGAGPLLPEREFGEDRILSPLPDSEGVADFVEPTSGERVSVATVLGQLPFRSIVVDEARFRWTGGVEAASELRWSIQLSETPTAPSARLSIGERLMEADFKLMPKGETGAYDLIGSGQLELSGVAEVMQSIPLEAFGALDGLEVESVEPAQFDVLVAEIGSALQSWSFDVHAQGLRIHDNAAGYAEIDEMSLLGYGGSEGLALEGGLSFDEAQFGGFKVNACRVRLSVSEETWTLYSNAFPLRLNELSGSAAIRGGGLLGLNGVASGQAELAFSELKSASTVLGPFSLHITDFGMEPLFRVSPIEIEGGGRLLISDTEGLWSCTENRGHVKAEVQGAAGSYLGKLFLEVSRHASGMELNLTVADEQLQEFLSGRFAFERRLKTVEGEGIIPLTWLQEAMTWTGLADYTLSGEAGLDLSFRLEAGLLPKGWARLAFSGLSLCMPNGINFREMGTQLQVRVFGLPATVGLQELEIGTVEWEDFRFEDIVIQWAMPSLQQIVVEKTWGRFREGTVEGAPFTFDPQYPEIVTRLNFESIPVQVILDLLKEDRFRMEGRVRGQLGIGFKATRLQLGEGLFELEQQAGPARFVFQDEVFLRRSVQGLGSVSSEVRDRLLEALSREGIAVDGLRLSMSPTSADELTVRLELSGHCTTEAIEIPIEGFVINQRISFDDLGKLIGVQVGPLFGGEVR